jgi:hypothetical protein
MAWHVVSSFSATQQQQQQQQQQQMQMHVRLCRAPAVHTTPLDLGAWCIANISPLSEPYKALQRVACDCQQLPCRLRCSPATGTLLSQQVDQYVVCFALLSTSHVGSMLRRLLSLLLAPCSCMQPSSASRLLRSLRVADRGASCSKGSAEHASSRIKHHRWRATRHISSSSRRQWCRAAT